MWWEIPFLFEGAALIGLTVLVTMGVRQLLSQNNRTKIKEEWTDNPKPTDESVEFETKTRGLAVVTARTIGELASKHRLSRLGLKVDEIGKNQLHVWVSGQGEHVEEFIQEVKYIL